MYPLILTNVTCIDAMLRATYFIISLGILKCKKTVRQFLDQRRNLGQRGGGGAAALEKGTLFYISKKARTPKFRRLSVFIKSIFV